MNINWQRATMNIRQSGMSLQAASKRIGANKNALAQLARGEINEPKFSQGIAILDLHVDLCGVDMTRELGL